MNKYYVYDTSALLEKVNDLFNSDENIIIPSTVLEELDALKRKNVKNVNKLISLLNQNKNKYVVYIYKPYMIYEIFKLGISEITPDMKILAAAIDYDKEKHPDETILVTNDINLQNIANLYFGEDNIISVTNNDTEEHYSGVEEIQVNDTALAYFYEHLDENIFDLKINQYLILKDFDNNIIDKYCWNGQKHRPITFQNFESSLLGELKPKKGDIYQMLAFDSVSHNQITLLKGTAGTGKSIIAISYLVSMLEKGKIDKIIIFCNPVATLNSARLGFYPGDKNTKLLDSQIGNFLYSKFGGEQSVKNLMENEQLILLPLSDIRGYDTTGMRAGIYITEAQNMDISLMKLALQRIGEDSIVVIDGDCETQVDDKAFEGKQNGMKRLSKVFRGVDLYGEVELKTIHRSRIAAIAEQL